jgi:predicted RNase H-like nuclease (RuvC/YqgF family)
MAFPLVPVAIGSTVAAGVSIAVNIYQAVQNRKLRKQIQRLQRINDDLRDEIEEARKELKALKIWCFKQRINLHRYISDNKKEIKENNREIVELEQQVA